MPTNARRRNGSWCIIGGDVSRLDIPVLCGIRDQFDHLPGGIYSLRTVSPESDTLLTYLSPVVSNQPDSGVAGLARIGVWLDVNSNTLVGLVATPFGGLANADRRALDLIVHKRPASFEQKAEPDAGTLSRMHRVFVA